MAAYWNGGFAARLCAAGRLCWEELGFAYPDRHQQIAMMRRSKSGSRGTLCCSTASIGTDSCGVVVTTTKRSSGSLSICGGAVRSDGRRWRANLCGRLSGGRDGSARQLRSRICSGAALLAIRLALFTRVHSGALLPTAVSFLLDLSGRSDARNISGAPKKDGKRVAEEGEKHLIPVEMLAREEGRHANKRGGFIVGVLARVRLHKHDDGERYTRHLKKGFYLTILGLIGTRLCD